MSTASLYNARLYIERLKKYNCLFSLDDFGRGVSSFSYLKNLPVDYLKIDGALVRDIAQDPVDYALVAAINQIRHSMIIKTIAEFVENQQILDTLKEMGVDYVQGFHIKKPFQISGLIK